MRNCHNCCYTCVIGEGENACNQHEYSGDWCHVFDVYDIKNLIGGIMSTGKIKCFFGFHDIDYEPTTNLRYPVMEGKCERCGKRKSYVSRYPFKRYENSDEVSLYRAKIDSRYKRDEATRLFNIKHGLGGE